MICLPVTMSAHQLHDFTVYLAHIRAHEKIRTSRCGLFFSCDRIPSSKPPVDFVYELLSNMAKRHKKSPAIQFSRATFVVADLPLPLPSSDPCAQSSAIKYLCVFVTAATAKEFSRWQNMAQVHGASYFGPKNNHANDDDWHVFIVDKLNVAPVNHQTLQDNEVSCLVSSHTTSFSFCLLLHTSFLHKARSHLCFLVVISTDFPVFFTGSNSPYQARIDCQPSL